MKSNLVGSVRSVVLIVIASIVLLSSCSVYAGDGKVHFDHIRSKLFHADSIFVGSVQPSASLDDSDWKSAVNDAHSQWDKKFDPAYLYAKDRALDAKDAVLQNGVNSLYSKDRTHDSQIADLYRILSN